MHGLKKVIYSVILVIATIVAGTVGYTVIEGFSPFDSLYMTIITLTTVGFQELKPLSSEGRIFTIFIILAGLGIFSFFITSITSFVVEGNLRGIFWRNKMLKKIDSLKNHHIICGLGKIGKIICQQLYEKNIPFVVIDKDKALADTVPEGYIYIIGDATQDDILTQAGIQRAKTLVTVLNTDSDNVYVTLSARGMRNELFILTRKSDNISSEKLYRAGASKVISPHEIGANHMVQILTHPHVTEFIANTLQGKLGLVIEEFLIPKESFLSGKNLMTSGLRQNYNAIVIGIRESNGKMIYNPPVSHEFKENDLLIAIGPAELMLKMRKDLMQ